MAAIPIHEVIDRLLHRGRARFLVDTCFLLDPGGLRALEESIWANLHSRDCAMVLPYAVLRELESHVASPNDEGLASSSRKVLGVLKQRGTLGHIRTLGTAGESFADQTLLEVFTRFRLKYDLVLFSNDNGLSRDLLRLNATESTRTRNEIWVAWNYRGGIYAATDLADLKRAPAHHSRRESRKPATAEERPQLFPHHTAPRPVDETRVGGTKTFAKGATLRGETSGPICLRDSVARGGEGEIFAVNAAQVAKVYFPDKRTTFRAEKLSLMCAHPVGVPAVNWPTERLFDADGGFIGFLMPAASGKPLQACAFGKACVAENFPGWNRRNIVTLAANVATIVQALNDLGVIVGDINPMNFLIANEKDIRLVDADSMQVGDFPCLVGMNNFRAPEITADRYKEFLRTDAHERFALATLLFMILMGGKAPFSFQGGGDPIENIRKGNFPYVTNQQQIPAGAYRYIWSHFPHPIKAAFGRAFVGGDPGVRPSAAEWVRLLRRYERELEQPDSPDALQIWPTSFKPRKGSTTVQLKCAECQTCFQTSAKDAEKRRQYPKILCGTCLTILTMARNSGQNHTCKECGKLFTVPFHSVQRYSTVVPVCEPCLHRMAAEHRRCQHCGRGYQLEFGELQFHLAKGLSLPARCRGCRGNGGSRRTSTSGQRNAGSRSATRSPPTHTPPRSSQQPPSKPPRRPPRQPPQIPQKTLWDLLKSFFE